MAGAAGAGMAAASAASSLTTRVMFEMLVEFFTPPAVKRADRSFATPLIRFATEGVGPTAATRPLAAIKSCSTVFRTAVTALPAPAPASSPTAVSMRGATKVRVVRMTVRWFQGSCRTTSINQSRFQDSFGYIL